VIVVFFGCIFFSRKGERNIFFSLKKRVVDNLKESRRLGAIDSRAIEEKCSVGRNIFIFFLIFVVFLEVDCIVCCAFIFCFQTKRYNH